MGRADAEQIHDFRTVMTGELHHLLLKHSLVGPVCRSRPLRRKRLPPGLSADRIPAVLPQLFEVRASHVLGNLPREQVSEFLSGLLIGAEVATLERRVRRAAGHHARRGFIADVSLPPGVPRYRTGCCCGGRRHGISGRHKEHRSCSGKLNFP